MERPHVLHIFLQSWYQDKVRCVGKFQVEGSYEEIINRFNAWDGSLFWRCPKVKADNIVTLQGFISGNEHF